jgi:hypothetical protein
MAKTLGIKKSDIDSAMKKTFTNKLFTPLSEQRTTLERIVAPTEKPKKVLSIKIPRTESVPKFEIGPREVTEPLVPFEPIRDVEVRPELLAPPTKIKVPFKQRERVAPPVPGVDVTLKFLAEYPEKIGQSIVDIFNVATKGETIRKENKLYVPTFFDESLKVYSAARESGFDENTSTILGTVAGVGSAIIDFGILFDIAARGALAVTSFNPATNQALTRLGLDRSFTFEAFKENFQNAKANIIRTGDVRGAIQLIDDALTISKSLRAEGVPTGGLTKFVQDVSKNIVKPLGRPKIPKFDITPEAERRLTEVAGFKPIQPFAPRPQPSLGLSIRPIPEKPIKPPKPKAKPIPKELEKDLLKEATEFKGRTLDEFIGRVRGSATQLGESRPALRKFGIGEKSERISNLGIDPEKEVVIYRGIPEDVKREIRDGDFITLSYEQALAYTDSPKNVVSKTVKAKDLIAQYPDEFVRDVKEYGFEVAGEGELIYSDSKNPIIKITKQQLTDFYNQATKEVKPVAKPEEDITELINRKFEEARVEPEVDIEFTDEKPVSLKERVQEIEGNIWVELDTAEAGRRIGIRSDEIGVSLKFLAQRSTFPKWIPENLRKKPLVKKVADNLLKGTRPPKKAVAQTELYNTVLGQISERTGISISEVKTILRQKISLTEPKIRVSKTKLNTMINELLGRAKIPRPVPKAKVKRIVRKVTGLERPKRLVAEREALKAVLKKEKRVAKIAKISEIQRLRVREREVRNDIREIKNIEKAKAAESIKEIKANKAAQLKEYKAQLRNRQERALELLDKLPPELQGRMKQAIKETTTDIRLQNLERRVNKRLELLERAEALKEAKSLASAAKVEKITTKYQRLIKDLTAAYNFQKPTAKTISRLRALRSFLQRNPEAPVPQKYIDDLKRLERKSLRDLDVADIVDFNKTLRHLAALGKEVQKHRIIVSKTKFKTELNEALASTKNLDFKNRDLHMAMETHSFFEFTFRVADKTDGSQGYKGWHAKFVKELGGKVNVAEVNQANRMNDFWQEHLEISEKTLSIKEQKEVAAHLYFDQGGLEQANKILIDLEIKELPKLTDAQEKIKELLKKSVGEKTKDIQPLWEVTMTDKNGRPMLFEIQDNYFPFYYEEKSSDLGIYSIIQDYKVQSKIVFGSGFERKAGVDLTPRVDIYKMTQEAIAKQELFLGLQPTLLEKGTIFRTKDYRNKAGKFNTDYWTGYVDDMSRNGMSSTAVRTPIDRWLRRGRQNISRGLLDLSFTTTAIQPLAVIDAMAYMATYMPKKTVFATIGNFIQSFVRPNFARKTIEQSLALRTRKGGEEVIATFDERKMKRGKKIPNSLWSKAIQKVKSPFAALQFFDIRTAAAVQKTAVNELAKIMPMEQAKAEADFIMDLVSGSTNIAYRPRIMNKGELGRLITTFQTFVLNEWGLLIQDIVKKGIFLGGKNRSITTRLWAVLGLALLFLQGYLEDKLRNRIGNIVRGTDYESNKFLRSSLLYLPERIPVFGNFVKGLEYGRAELAPPLISVFTNIVTGIQEAIERKKIETKLIHLSRAIESFTILFLGVPGAKEAQNIIERLIREKVKTKPKRLGISLSDISGIKVGEIKVKKKEDDTKKNPFQNLIDVFKGLTIDPANVVRAVFTKEKLGKVEGKLVELQRDFGEPYLNKDGSLNPKGSAFLKKELAKELGISEWQLPKLRREHIVPVSAGGSNSPSNLQLIPAELHQSYIPVDIAVGRAVKGGRLSRKEATRLMRALKVDRTMTIDEVLEAIKQ